MPPDPETGWSLVAVAPRVDRCHRDSEIVGEVFNGEQPINGFHGRILRRDPCRRVDIDVRGPVTTALRHGASGVGRGFLG